MHFITTAFAATCLLGSSLAVPVSDAASYHWQITKWSFCRGQAAYDYSFTVCGDANGSTPGFSATCTGTQKGGYAACTVAPKGNGAASPEVYANVNIVQDPNDPNDNIPRVFVKTTFTDGQDCSYTSIGHADSSLNCGAKKGSRFQIVPKDMAVC